MQKLSRFAENLGRDEKKNFKYLFRRRHRVGGTATLATGAQQVAAEVDIRV